MPGVNPAPGPPPLERELLEELRARTGLRSHRIQGIPVAEKAVADLALPILAEWYERLDDVDYRAAIVLTFSNSPHAHPYLDTVLQWWKRETEPRITGFLTQLVAQLMRNGDAVKVFEACKEVPPDPFRIFILSKLARAPSTAEDAKDLILRNLQTGAYHPAELERISRVNDERIRAWFFDHLNDPDEHIRSVSNSLFQTRTSHLQ